MRQLEGSIDGLNPWVENEWRYREVIYLPDAKGLCVENRFGGNHQRRPMVTGAGLVEMDIGH